MLIVSKMFRNLKLLLWWERRLFNRRGLDGIAVREEREPWVAEGGIEISVMEHW